LPPPKPPPKVAPKCREMMVVMFLITMVLILMTMVLILMTMVLILMTMVLILMTMVMILMTIVVIRCGLRCGLRCDLLRKNSIDNHCVMCQVWDVRVDEKIHKFKKTLKASPFSSRGVRSTPGLLTCGKTSTPKGSPIVVMREAIFVVGRPPWGRYHVALFYPGVLATLVPSATERRRLQRHTATTILLQGKRNLRNLYYIIRYSVKSCSFPLRLPLISNYLFTFAPWLRRYCSYTGSMPVASAYRRWLCARLSLDVRR